MYFAYTKVVDGEDSAWLYTGPSGTAPFKSMKTGDAIKLRIETNQKNKVQRYAHCYGKKTGKKFKTKVVMRTSAFNWLLVERVA